MSDPNSLTTDWCTHPLVVGHKTLAERQPQLTIIQLHQLIMGSGTAPALQDVQLRISPEHASLPLTITTACYTLLNFLIIIQAGGWGASHH
jgi:hypothetical protein